MLLIPTQPVPSQNFQVVLAGQQMTFNVYQTLYGLFLDALLSGVPILTGQICEDRERMMQDPALGFSGNLEWVDTMGTDSPVYTGLGTRWQLIYLELADL